MNRYRSKIIEIFEDYDATRESSQNYWIVKELSSNSKYAAARKVYDAIENGKVSFLPVLDDSEKGKVVPLIGPDVDDRYNGAANWEDAMEIVDNVRKDFRKDDIWIDVLIEHSPIARFDPDRKLIYVYGD